MDVWALTYLPSWDALVEMRVEEGGVVGSGTGVQSPWVFMLFDG
jgi:hypothetical protein